jgi:hypothetical protein
MGFLFDIYLRFSCYNCSAKSLKSGSDITLADYWGIQNVLPDFDDDIGISALLINTEHGNDFFKKIKCNTIKTSYEDMIRGNPYLEKSCLLPAQRVRFFKGWQKKRTVKQYIYKFTRSIRIRRSIVNISVKILRKVHLLDTVKSILKK